MFKKYIQLMLGFLCGYLFIEWLPITFPINISKLLVQYILDPIEFFASTIVFILGFILNAKIIRDVIEETIKLFKNNSPNLLVLSVSLSVFIGFVFLFFQGFWQTVGFFFFSMIYGIISIDFQKLNLRKD